MINYVTNEITHKTYAYMLNNDNWIILETNSINANGNSIKSTFSTSSSTGVYNANTTIYYMVCK